MIRRLLMFVVMLGLASPALAQVSAPPARPKPKATEKAAEAKAKTELATFGGGCFWCFEAVYERIPGVKNVVSGYSGGSIARPSYELVSTGQTGHAEVVQIEFDPEVVTYEKLLDTFWHFHDPTTLNRQGPDEGTQYRSVIFYRTDEQKKAAQDSYDQLTTAKVFDAPIVTDLVAFKAFYAADKHHQDYYRKNKAAAYCRMYITPKLKKLGVDKPAEKK